MKLAGTKQFIIHQAHSRLPTQLYLYHFDGPTGCKVNHTLPGFRKRSLNTISLGIDEADHRVPPVAALSFE